MVTGNSVLAQDKLEELKYNGITLSNIEYFSFNLFQFPAEQYESGEKIVPGVVKIPVEEDSQVDYDLIIFNLLISKINSGSNLLPFEKEKLIGIKLGMNNGEIDSRLLDLLGYDIEMVQSCENILYYRYKTKEHRQTLTDTEKKELTHVKIRRYLQYIIKVQEEIKKSRATNEEVVNSQSALNDIFSSLIHFEPSILFYNSKPIYWDVDSYIHIAMRHIKQLQFGKYKEKSLFPYKFEDLKLLIQKILEQVRGEIERSYQDNANSPFRRNGKMAVLFNDDYYCLFVDAKGRLETAYLYEGRFPYEQRN